MATSDSIDLNLTAQQVVTYALRLINVAAQTETPTADDSERGRLELTLMLKDWMRYEHIWRQTEGYVQVLHNTQGYSLTPRPYRIHAVRYRSATGGTDLQMTEMTREQYYNLPDKTTEGTSTMWFFDHQRDTDSLWVWPVFATDGGNVASYRVTYQRRFEDQDTLTDNIDIPQQYLGVVGYNLAARLADSYGRSGGHIDRIVARAEMLKQEMLDDDREAFIQLVPDYGR